MSKPMTFKEAGERLCLHRITNLVGEHPDANIVKETLDAMDDDEGDEN